MPSHPLRRTSYIPNLTTLLLSRTSSLGPRHTQGHYGAVQFQTDPSVFGRQLFWISDARFALCWIGGPSGLVTTHDLALTDIGTTLDGHLRNVHFQEEFENGRMSFDYKVRDGVATMSNGLALMR